MAVQRLSLVIKRIAFFRTCWGTADRNRPRRSGPETAPGRVNKARQAADETLALVSFNALTSGWTSFAAASRPKAVTAARRSRGLSLDKNGNTRPSSDVAAVSLKPKSAA